MKVGLCCSDVLQAQIRLTYRNIPTIESTAKPQITVNINATCGAQKRDVRVRQRGRQREGEGERQRERVRERKKQGMPDPPSVRHSTR